MRPPAFIPQASRCLALATTTLILQAAHAQETTLPRVPLMTATLATEAATAAVAACAAQGYGVAATVVDRAGVVLAVQRAEMAGPHTLDSSRRKAYTAASLGVDTAKLDETVRSKPDASSLREVQGFLILGGGVPIRLDGAGALVGAIGVGGTPSSATDAGCAQAGIRQIQSKLR